jgi:hypothetical protein
MAAQKCAQHRDEDNAVFGTLVLLRRLLA